MFTFKDCVSEIVLKNNNTRIKNNNSIDNEWTIKYIILTRHYYKGLKNDYARRYKKYM